MSKIGLLVVYVFDDTLQPLFDIHLNRIQRFTTSEYKIYAAGHKLAEKQFDYVSKNPDIQLFKLDVPKEYGVRDEHSFCLRNLADAAYADGCEHVICMHLDSFPVVKDWQKEFVGPIERGEASVVSIVPNGYSAGLCWGKEFDEQLTPGMLVSTEDRTSEVFEKFVTEFPDFDHIETGLGIIFTAYQNALTWKRIGTDQQKKIYGGLLFHLVGATWRTWIDAAPVKKSFLSKATWPIVKRIIRRLPVKQRRSVKSMYIDFDRVSRDGSFNSKMAENVALMTDPDGYVEKLLNDYKSTENTYG